MATYEKQGAKPKAKRKVPKTESPKTPGRNIDVKNLELSFCGCGFLGIYHVGVASAFQTFLPDCSFSNLSGASAGAIAATGLIANVPVAQMASTLMDTCEKARTYVGGPFNPNYQVSDVLSSTLKRMLPDDIAERANGKLNISVTKVSDGKNTVISNFADKDELIKIIVASAFIPVFSGHIPEKVRGQRVIDGGFSVNLFKLSDNTITVSPLAGDADICPLDGTKTRDYEIARLKLSQQGHDMTLKNLERLRSVLFPPSSEVLSEILMQGFRDAHRFLRVQGLVSCSQCMTVRSTLHQEQDSNSEPHIHSRKCRSGLDCEQYSESNLSMPSTLSTIVDFFVRSVKPEKEKNEARRYKKEELEITTAEAEHMASSLIWQIGAKIFWSSPPVWMFRKSLSMADLMFRITMDLAGPLFEMIPLKALMSSDSLTEAFEKSLSLVLHTVSSFLSLGSYVQRVKSTKELINCEVRISQFGTTEESLNEDEDVGWRRRRRSSVAATAAAAAVSEDRSEESEGRSEDSDEEQNVLEIEVNAVSEHRSK